MDPKTMRARDIQDAIRQVLLDRWDPYGVKGYCSAPDEYDSFIAPVYRLLCSCPTEDEVMQHLLENELEITETERERERRLRSIAKQLLEVDVTLQQESNPTTKSRTIE
jgi:hypothetical protein